jgi:hypothetical protein
MRYEGFQDVTSTFEEACGVGGANYSSTPCAAYVQARIAEIGNEATDRKQNVFTKTFVDFQRTVDMDHQAVYSGIRNANLKNVADYIKDHNSATRNYVQHDKDLSKRQFEINEYYYNNKLDTLFFLQVLLISTLAMAIIIYMNKKGILTTPMSGILTLLLTVIVVIVGVTRYFYTTRTRDRRLWHKRYFQTEGEPKPDLLSCPTTGPTAGPTAYPILNLNAVLDESTTQCYADMKDTLDGWNDTLTQEVKNQISGAGGVNSIWGSSGSSLPESCKKRN